MEQVISDAVLAGASPETWSCGGLTSDFWKKGTSSGVSPVIALTLSVAARATDPGARCGDATASTTSAGRDPFSVRTALVRARHGIALCERGAPLWPALMAFAIWPQVQPVHTHPPAHVRAHTPRERALDRTDVEERCEGSGCRARPCYQRFPTASDVECHDIIILQRLCRFPVPGFPTSPASTSTLRASEVVALRPSVMFSASPPDTPAVAVTSPLACATPRADVLRSSSLRLSNTA